MDNEMSLTSRFRSCGICYFKLTAGSPFLEQPIVSRRFIVETTSGQEATSSREAGRLDDVLLPPKNASVMELKTEPVALRVSSERGCVGCAAILKCLDNILHDQGFTLDEPCWHSQCTLRWFVGHQICYEPSLRVDLRVTTRTGNHDTQHQEKHVDMLLGYTAPTYCMLLEFVLILNKL